MNDETWNLPHNRWEKVFVVEYLIRWLSEEGFWWQAKRLRNHLNLWKKSHQLLIGHFTAPKAAIPSDDGGGGGDSL